MPQKGDIIGVTGIGLPVFNACPQILLEVIKSGRLIFKKKSCFDFIGGGSELGP